MATSLNEQYVTECKIQMGGTNLPPEATQDLLAATVQDDVDHPSCFALTMNNWNPDKIAMKWSDDDDLFRVGKQVEVSMGPVGQVKSLIVGEITGCELQISDSQAPVFIVRGYDRGHRLSRGRRTMSYTNLKDSDIATQMAGRYGLSAEVEGTTQTYDYLLQHDQTDGAFLRERARRIGYEVFVREKKLIFRSRKNGASAQATLSRTSGLLDFHCRLSTLQQGSKTAVRSWDPANKDAWVGVATSSDENNAMGGDQTGLARAEQIFGEACISSGAHPSASQAEADQSALRYLQRMALNYMIADGTTVGRTDLRAGTVVELQGLGKRFSGPYYLTSTIHTYYSPVGYRTEFEARRNAA